MRKIRIAGALVALALLLCACQGAAPEESASRVTEPVGPNQFVFSDGSVIEYDPFDHEEGELIQFTFADVNDPDREFTEEEESAICEIIVERIDGEED